ncbi:MAG TPA: AbrB/MazE/SpoVT family DNA-binding domain-containing protein [Patescibacteria group bacterium]|nr:AbrB/MazE/SpoVT family DNA-binding domain-containing protein [Patescibacteria group bacterium]
MKSIIRATSKGQITLPAAWRKNVETNQYLLKVQEGSLLITPLDVGALEDENWETVFDAKIHAKGKGIPLDNFIDLLRKTL